ncbi:hypothetical protein EHM92_02580 [bacterium]|nr:MAG: hypothetical protein EHM92_02580 [bacterium]
MNNPLTVPKWFGNDTTRTRAVYQALLNLHERPENADLEAPDVVKVFRQVNDSLHGIDAKLSRIEEGQRRTLRGLWQAFWKGMGTVKKEGDNLLK